MAFKDVRRQKFLSEKDYLTNYDWFEDSVRRARKILVDEELIPEAKDSFRWRIASDNLSLLILQYTAGKSISELRAHLTKVIEDFDTFVANEISPHDEDSCRLIVSVDNTT